RGADHVVLAGGRVAVAVELREGFGFARARPRALPRLSVELEAAEAVVDAGDEARVAGLAVLDDIRAQGALPAPALGERGPQARGVGFRVDGLALFLGAHHVEQIGGPRQAAHVGGENSVDATLHGASRCVLLPIARLHDVPHHHFALGRRSLVEFRIHPARHAFARERRLEFLANGGILLVIRYGAAAFAEIDSAGGHELLAGTAGLARALVVGPLPGGDAQAFLADSQM